MMVAQHLNILLADTDYRQYLLMKGHLSDKNGCDARILWCGEPDQYLHAMQSGIYDLVFLQYDMESLFLLEQLENNGYYMPVVMLADEPNDHLVAKVCQCGALDLLCRKQPDVRMLRHYVLYADMYRKGELNMSVSSDDGDFFSHDNPHQNKSRYNNYRHGNVNSIIR